MKHRSILLAATCLLASGALAQPAPTPPVAPPPPTDKKADPLSPQKAEQEPRPVSQELQKQASQGGAGTATAAVADPKAWDVNARHGPGHDVALDTREGTWMSVDVSPDGREVVFDLLGDIYVMPITGGEARSLTTGNAWDMQPRYSPSGT